MAREATGLDERANGGETVTLRAGLISRSTMDRHQEVSGVGWRLSLTAEPIRCAVTQMAQTSHSYRSSASPARST